MEDHMTTKMWVQLIEVRLRFIGLLIITGLVVGNFDTIVNYWERYTRSATPPETIVQDKIEFYCPMHPHVVRDEMGNCPICGMPLSKRVKGIAAPLPPDVLGRITISPYRIALAGIRTQKVEYLPLVREIEALGEVVFDERKVNRVAARFPGRIEKLLVNFAGIGVRVGDPMAQIYSPTLITTLQELLTNLTTGTSLGNVTSAIKKKLLFWGIESDQIEEVIKTKVVPENLTIRSTMNGIVTKKAVVEGQYVDEGALLFELANLNVVWVMAKVYQNDLAFIKVGQEVYFETVSYPGASFPGTIAYIEPVLERDTRTANVRIDFANRSAQLMPGMFGTIKILVPVSSLFEFQGLTGELSSETKTMYWCPMHPEVEQSTPGICEKCGGMKLIEKKIPVSQSKEPLYFSCPMHPGFREEHPGKCPLCKPYMDMDLEPHVATPSPLSVLAVPETAVIDTGARRVVYVDQGDGVFESRLVNLGPRAGIYYPIISGLKDGEKVVAHGSFLIDAETRLNPAAGAAFFGGSTGPSKSSDGDSKKSTTHPPGHSGHGG